jgi:glycine hydroxymethyltransferase
MIMCKEEHAKAIDKMIFPGIQGGPLMHVIAAKAVAFKEALAPGFTIYQKQVLANAKALAEGFVKRGYQVVSGGTENHLFLLNLTSKNVTGKEAEAALNASGIVVNKNAVPFDEKPPAVASGVRIGTPTVSTRGMQQAEMEQIVSWMDEIIQHSQDAALHKRILREVKNLCARFPIFHPY